MCPHEQRVKFWAREGDLKPHRGSPEKPAPEFLGGQASCPEGRPSQPREISALLALSCWVLPLRCREHENIPCTEYVGLPPSPHTAGPNGHLLSTAVTWGLGSAQLCGPHKGEEIGEGQQTGLFRQGELASTVSPK